MAVNTRKVTGRREVHYDSYHDLLSDAERLAGGEVRALGNWSSGQIFSHLARTMNMAIDGNLYKASWTVRMLVRLFLRRRTIKGPMPVGMQVPRALAEFVVPGPTSTDEGLAALRQAIQRLHDETERAPHPILGEMSLAEWDSFHLRHAELHMSFVVPVGVPAATS
jgi:hypothetical protein